METSTEHQSERPAPAALTDAEFLERFVGRQDQAAFEGLVRRHGPMIFRACSRLLGNEHDAADAFQAVFMVLARKAASLRHPEVLGTWLYQVACRCSLKARTVRNKRAARERQVSVMPESAVNDPEIVNDLAEVLDVELRALPAKYQAPIVLCDLEGMTRRHVAASLKLSEGTLSSRLATARKKLAQRLRRRGVTVSATALALTLAHEASAGMPAVLISTTVQTAVPVAAGQTVAAGTTTATSLAIADGVIKGMLWAKVNLVLLAVLGLSALGSVFYAAQTILNAPVQEAAQPDEQSKVLALLAKLGARLRWENTANGRQLVMIDLKGTPVQNQHLPVLAVFKELHELVLNDTAVTSAGIPALASLPNLWILQLQRTGLTNAGLQALAALQNIKTLELANTGISDAGVVHLAALPELATLRLENNGLTDGCLPTLATFPALASLSLVGNHGVTNNGLEKLLPLKRLTALNLSATSTTDAAIPVLAGFKNLGFLALDQTQVTGTGFSDPSQFKLNTLWLSESKVSDATIGKICALTKLHNLNLPKTALSDEGVKQLLSLEELQTLSLENTEITDRALAHLAKLPKISVLNLGATKITDAGVKSLVAMPQLRWLSVNRTEITDAGLKELLAVPNIDTLWISWTKISENGLKDVAAFKKLRNLRLGGIPVTDEGLKKLRPLTNLDNLWLDWTKITDGGLKNLLAFEFLEELRLDGTQVTEAGLQALAPLKNLQRIDMKGAKITLVRTAENKTPSSRTLRGHTGPVHGLCFTPDGRRLVSVSGWPGNDFSVRIWDLTTNAQLYRIQASGQIGALILTPDGRFALAGAQHALLQIDVETGQLVKRFTGFTSPCPSLTLSRDGKFAYSAHLDGFVRRWNLETGREVARFKVAGKWARYAVELPDGRLVTADQDSLIQIWDPATGAETKRIATRPSWLFSGQIVPDGNELMLANWNIASWDLDAGVKTSFQVVQPNANALIFAPDGKELLTLSGDGSARLWDAGTGRPLGVLLVQDEFLHAGAYSKDGRYVAVAGGGKKVGDKYIGGSAHDIHIFERQALAAAGGSQAIVVTSADTDDPDSTKSRGGWLKALALVLLIIVLSGVPLFVWLRRGKKAVPAATSPSFTFACTHCGQRLRLKADPIGKKIRCPKCKQATATPGVPQAT